MVASFLSGLLLTGLSEADDGSRRRGLLEHFDRPACYQVAQSAGRSIARARWEQHYPEAKLRSASLPQGTPEWIVAVVDDWITDAYRWVPTDGDVRAWAGELGDATAVPTAAQLSVPETIAIWMRRLGRDCDAREKGV
ncbi:MAG: hypothetical protein IT532_07645 [Burkholderiales bacterium]|nr:hypothetical protein [Burkholderiales bacterium]